MTQILDLLEAGAGGSASIEDWPTQESSTLAELWRRAEGLSRWFSGRSQPGDRVAMMLENTLECVAVLIAAWRSGVTVVSLPTRPIGLSHQEYVQQIGSLCDLTEAGLVVGGERAVGRYGAALGTAHPAVTFSSVHGGRGPVRTEHGDFIQCSSGTTGQPKAILLSAEGIAANVSAIVARYRLEAPMASMSWLPLSHDMGLVGMLLTPWAYCGLHLGQGGRVVLMKPEVFLRSPRSWMRACAETGATVTAGPTFALETAAAARSAEPLDLQALEIVCVGAEPVWADVLRRFEAALEPAGLRDTALSPAYGMAEATLGISAVGPANRWTTARLPARGTLAASDAVSAGPPLDGVEVCTDDGGQLLVRSPSLLRGYVGRATSPTIDGWYCTADLGEVIDGEVFVRGRTDDIIFVAGRNVNAADVEQEIQRAVANDVGGCVLVPDGSGRYAVLATLARADPAVYAVTATAVRQAATAALGAQPSRVMFVPRRALQRTGTGKLRRAILAADLAADRITALFTADTRRRSRE